jgi:hypothetical protein
VTIAFGDLLRERDTIAGGDLLRERSLFADALDETRGEDALAVDLDELVLE